MPSQVYPGHKPRQHGIGAHPVSAPYVRVRVEYAWDLYHPGVQKGHSIIVGVSYTLRFSHRWTFRQVVEKFQEHFGVKLSKVVLKQKILKAESRYRQDFGNPDALMYRKFKEVLKKAPTQEVPILSSDPITEKKKRGRPRKVVTNA